MYKGTDRTLQEPRAMIPRDLSKQKVKHTDVNGSNDLPESEKIDIVIDRTLQEPRVMMTGDLTKRKIKNIGRSSNSSWDSTTQIIKHSDDHSHEGLSNRSSDISNVKPFVGFTNVLLLVATIIAAITFQVPFHLLGSTVKVDKQDSVMGSSVIFCNSLMFIASAAVIILLLDEFPFKPLPQISILALFCCYVCTLMAI